MCCELQSTKTLYHNFEFVTIVFRTLLRISIHSNTATDHPADFVEWPVDFVFIKPPMEVNLLKAESLSFRVNLSLTNPVLVYDGIALALQIIVTTEAEI